MMQGPLFGLIVMGAMIVGLVWWCLWAMRSDRKKNKEE